MTMISVEQARQVMLDSAILLAPEQVPLPAALWRVLAASVTADVDMPPFDKSAMDGFACRRTDLGNPLTVIEQIAAGQMPTRTLAAGQCAKIMTGAPVPDGADCVIMIEHTAIDPDGRVRFTAGKSADNICRRAEDVRAGDVVLSAGALISPAHIAVLASAGTVAVPVSRRPRVAVLATGSELVEPGAEVAGALIRNSNSYQLCAQLQALGIPANYGGIIPDQLAPTTAALDAAAHDHDLIVVSGGVSMGDYDLVPEALLKTGFELLFDSVAMQPGRPTIFGRRRNVFCVGMPGNPVSTFIVFELLLKPFLYRLMGHAFTPPMIEAELGETIRRRKTERQSTIPMRFVDARRVVPVDYHGSAHIHAMCRTDALLTMPVGVAELTAGERVHVRPL